MSLLWQAQLARLLLSSVVLFQTNLPFWLKITAVSVIDLFDCSVTSGPFLIDDKSYCTLKEYSPADKTGDLLSYLLLYIYMYQQPEFQSWRSLLFAMWLFRVIGFLTYLCTENRHWFIVFPDLFRESLLFLAFTTEYWKYWEQKHIYGGLTLLLSYSIIKEVVMHFNKT